MNLTVPVVIFGGENDGAIRAVSEGANVCHSPGQWYIHTGHKSAEGYPVFVNTKFFAAFHMAGRKRRATP